MNSKQSQRIMSNPKAFMDFKMQGKVPRTSGALKTPLWELLNSLTPRERVCLIGIKLGPHLGYSNGMTFRSGEQLFQWLGGTEKWGDWQRPVSESYVNRQFKCKLAVSDLTANVTK